MADTQHYTSVVTFKVGVELLPYITPEMVPRHPSKPGKASWLRKAGYTERLSVSKQGLQ